MLRERISAQGAPSSTMSSQHIFFFFAKSFAFLTLAAFMLAHTCAMVWGAETLQFGFSGATATQLAGSLAVAHKLFLIYGVNVEFTQSAGTVLIRGFHSRTR